MFEVDANTLIYDDEIQIDMVSEMNEKDRHNAKLEHLNKLRKQHLDSSFALL